MSVCTICLLSPHSMPPTQPLATTALLSVPMIPLFQIKKKNLILIEVISHFQFSLSNECLWHLKISNVTEMTTHEWMESMTSQRIWELCLLYYKEEILVPYIASHGAFRLWTLSLNISGKPGCKKKCLLMLPCYHCSLYSKRTTGSPCFSDPKGVS